MEYLNLPVNRFKHSDEKKGSFSGYASSWNLVPSKKMKILPGAFQNSIARGASSVKALFYHDPTRPIGKYNVLTEDDDGLWFEGNLTLGVRDADETLLLMDDEVIDHVSIGFDIVESKMNKGVREVSDLILYEISPVTFAANDEARIMNVHDNDDVMSGTTNADADIEYSAVLAESADDNHAADFNETDQENELRSRGYRLLDSLYETLMFIWWAEETNGQERELLERALLDFSEAYLAWADAVLSMSSGEMKADILPAKNQLARTALIALNGKPPGEAAAKLPLTVSELTGLTLGKLFNSSIIPRINLWSPDVAAAYLREKNRVADSLRIDTEEMRASRFMATMKDRVSKQQHSDETAELRDAMSRLSETLSHL